MSQDDYDWDEHDVAMSHFFRERAQQGQGRREKWLTEASKRLAVAHKVDVAGQRTLLEALLGTRLDVLSSASLDPDNWHIPRDLTPWKEARRRLITLANNLGSATEILKVQDQVVVEGLLHASSNLGQQYPDLVRAIFAFEEVAREAASIEGKSGNRPHPPWKFEAVKLCRDFWQEQMNEEPRRYFSAAKKPVRGQKVQNTTQPANAFSRWFCNVMYDVAKLPPYECDTLLRQQ